MRTFIDPNSGVVAPLMEFRYKNYRGEISNRRVAFTDLVFMTEPGFDYQPGWFVGGYDLDRKERRTFALTSIILPTEMKLYHVLFTMLQNLEMTQ